MGHLFLKLEGYTANEKYLEHAISFYTDADTWNLPMLFWESMVEGKSGYFALSPFHEEIDKYALNEQRSIWTYRLALNELQRQRLLSHIQELKQARIKYFFQNYNCATLVRHIIAVSHPDILSGPQWWTTPKDVLRQSSVINIIDEVSVQAPARWQVRNLISTLPVERIQQIDAEVKARTTEALENSSTLNEEEGFLSLHLAEALARYRYASDNANQPENAAYIKQLKIIRTQRYPDLTLNSAEIKNPALAPAERQIRLGALNHLEKNFVQLGFQPVSHTLDDDNRHYDRENELRLFDSNWLIDTKSGKISLDRLTLYSVKSFIPYEKFTGGVSGHFNLSIDTPPDIRRTDHKAFFISGGIGYTWRLAPDIDTYMMAGGGWAWRQSGSIYAEPEIGFIVREAWNMKSIVNHRWINPASSSNPNARIWSWTQSLHQKPDRSWIFNWQRIYQSNLKSDKISLSKKWLL